jgi:anti-anti-sigma factor
MTVDVAAAADGMIVLEVAGEVDLATVDELRESIDRPISDGWRRIVLDMRRVTFFGSAGLGVLAAAVNRLAPLGGALEVHEPSRNVRRALEITGMTGLVSVRGG